MQPSRQDSKILRGYYLSIIKYLSIVIIAGVLVAIYALTTSSSIPTYKTSWLGNTFGGGDKWVQLQISALYANPDGYVYANSIWDEAGREIGIYKNGDVIGKANDTHGWGRLGGVAITASNKYLYAAMTQSPSGKPGEDYPTPGTSWNLVRRYDLSGIPTSFAGGRGYDRSMLIVNTVNLDIFGTTDQGVNFTQNRNTGQINGLAYANNRLYVSDPAKKRIVVCDAETMREIGSWKVEQTGPLAVDRQGNLWLVSTKNERNISILFKYSQTGKLLVRSQLKNIESTAIATTSSNKLLIADNGLNQQILMYDIDRKPKLIDSLGIRGGIYKGKKGKITSQKLYALTGVGADKANNIYVSFDGFHRLGAHLRQYSKNKKLNWELLGLQFLDTADVDPTTDGVDVFTKNEHFKMNYQKERGQEGHYEGFTLDPFKYPDDPRLHTTPTAPMIRNFRGKRFLYLMSEMMSEEMFIYRFDGNIAVPCGIFAKDSPDNVNWPENRPKQASWMWRDRNGDGAIQTSEYSRLDDREPSIWGWEVDSKGDIWQAAEVGYIKHYFNRGLDVRGCPIYTASRSTKIPMPSPFNSLERIEYVPETDVMYLGGYTNERPRKGSPGSEWGIVGTEIVRYDNWSKQKKIRWRIVLPYVPDKEPMLIIKAMDIAGDRVFAVDSRKAEVYVYDRNSGKFLIKMSPGIEVAKESGWIDIPYALRAYRRKNGEYIVFVEEDWKAKIIMYRLKS